MRIRFEFARTQAQLRRDLGMLSNSGSVADYTDRFNTLLANINNMAEPDRVHAYVKNLRKDIREKVIAQDHDALSRAIRAAFLAEASGPATSVIANSFDEMQLAAFRRSQSRSGKFRGACYACGKVGHRKAECPNKARSTCMVSLGEASRDHTL